MSQNSSTGTKLEQLSKCALNTISWCSIKALQRFKHQKGITELTFKLELMYFRVVHFIKLSSYSRVFHLDSKNDPIFGLFRPCTVVYFAHFCLIGWVNFFKFLLQCLYFVEFFILIPKMAFFLRWEEYSICTACPTVNLFFGLFWPCEPWITFLV